jgi:hypothetical protein
VIGHLTRMGQRREPVSHTSPLRSILGPFPRAETALNRAGYHCGWNGAPHALYGDEGIGSSVQQLCRTQAGKGHNNL